MLGIKIVLGGAFSAKGTCSVKVLHLYLKRLPDYVLRRGIYILGTPYQERYI